MEYKQRYEKFYNLRAWFKFIKINFENNQTAKTHTTLPSIYKVLINQECFCPPGPFNHNCCLTHTCMIEVLHILKEFMGLVMLPQAVSHSHSVYVHISIPNCISNYIM